MRFKELKIELSKVKQFETINYKLEQYVTPPELAAYIIYSISDDINNKKVLDLCCGTGMLSVACQYFNPLYLLGIDICINALNVYKENMDDWLDYEIIRGDFSDLGLSTNFFDVVLMNPPFGTKIKHQDIKALDKALEIAPVVFSMHKTSTREYLLQKYPNSKVIAQMKYDLPRTYDFHKKKNKVIDVDFIRFVR